MDIEMFHVSKWFDTNLVLKDFDAVFTEGQVNCLMGASGIGKTTVINLLMGLMKQDSGEIRGIEGRRIAAVFQEDRLIEHFDAIKNVRLVCDKSVTAEFVEQEFQMVGLEEYKNKPVIKMSGGMRRRVAIVRALLCESDLVIMDEPFKGMDEALKNKVIEYTRQRTKGKTVIFVTHDKDEVRLLEAKQITLD